MLQKIQALLDPWVTSSEAFFFSTKEQANAGYYGGGYNGWSVQTNQKYLSAVAVCAALKQKGPGAEQARERALQALRFTLNSHLTGKGSCVDGTSWGHTWISVLGVERMMNGVFHLRESLSEEETQGLAKMLQSEADWLATSYHRGGKEGIWGGLWGKDGKNDPESNIWNGSLLWRVAEMYPEANNGSLWREQALQFLATGITTERDLISEEIWDGKALKERCRGPNFFPNYALDHHRYFNLGYMVICLSNIALAHFDARLWGYRLPELIHLRSRELWEVVKKMITQDGRLVRIGGDSRVRYAYCQEYLMQTLLYAADYLQDPHALELLEAQIRTVEEEQQANEDGSFYGTRLQWLKEQDPIYYTRLESDRSCSLGAVGAYWELLAKPEPAPDFEQAVSGGWSEPEHGEILHRSEHRLAAFSWNAFHPGQGTAIPPDDGHLLEWDYHLSGHVTFLGEVKQKSTRRSGNWWMESFDGGFVTQGAFQEGLEVVLGEGWKGQDLARHQLSWVALPDGHTVVAIEYATITNFPSWVREARGMHFNLPNDLFNHFERTLRTRDASWVLDADNRSHQYRKLQTSRLLVEDRIGLTGIYGGDEFVILHPPERTGGAFHSLYCDVVHYGGRGERFLAEKGEAVIDCAWSVETSADKIEVSGFFDTPRPVRLDWPSEAARAVEVTGRDGRRYRLFANFSAEPQPLPASLLEDGYLLAGMKQGASLAPGQSLLLVVRN